MPLTERNFGIKITTEADTSGAAAAAKSLEKVGESAEHGAHSSRALTEALSSINPQLGELGRMLHVSEFGAGFAGTMALGFAFNKLGEHLETVRQKIAQTIEAAIELKHRFEDALTNATIEAAAAQEKFAASLDEVARKRDIATEAMTRIISITQEETKTTETLIDAQLKLYEAQLNQAVARGETTPEAAGKAQREAEKQARAEKDAADDADTKAQEVARLVRREIARKEIKADQGELAPLNAQSLRQSAAIGSQQGEIKSRELELQAAIKAVSDAATWGKDPTKGLAFAAIHGGQAASNEEADRKKMASERLKAAEEELKTATEHAGVLQNEHDATLRKISLLDSEIQARTELVQKLTEEADQIGQDLKRRQASRAKIEAINERAQATADITARENRINSGKASADDVSIEKGYNSGLWNANSATRALESRFEMARRNAAQNLPGSKEELHSMLEQAIGIMEAVHEQQTNGRTGNAALASRLNALAARLDDSRWSHH